MASYKHACRSCSSERIFCKNPEFGMSGNLYNIPSGIPFARTLAAHLLQETKKNPQQLTQYKILLPTRRACRTLQNAFLQQNNGKPLLLPRLQPIGDVEEEELALNLAGIELADIPKAVSPLERQIELTKYIMR